MTDEFDRMANDLRQRLAVLPEGHLLCDCGKGSYKESWQVKMCTRCLRREVHGDKRNDKANEQFKLRSRFK